jgi:hypothetical protein
MLSKEDKLLSHLDVSKFCLVFASPLNCTNAAQSKVATGTGFCASRNVTGAG